MSASASAGTSVSGFGLPSILATAGDLMVTPVRDWVPVTGEIPELLLPLFGEGAPHGIGALLPDLVGSESYPGFGFSKDVQNFGGRMLFSTNAVGVLLKERFKKFTGILVTFVVGGGVVYLVVKATTCGHKMYQCAYRIDNDVVEGLIKKNEAYKELEECRQESQRNEDELAALDRQMALLQKKRDALLMKKGRLEEEKGRLEEAYRSME